MYNIFQEEAEEFKTWLDSVSNDSILNEEIINKVHEKYFDPNRSIAFIYTIDFIRGLCSTKHKERLTDKECMLILLKLWNVLCQDTLVSLAYDLIEEHLNEIKESN